MGSFEILPHAPGKELRIDTVGLRPMGPYKIGVNYDRPVARSYVKVPLENLAFPEILKMMIETNGGVEVEIREGNWVIYIG